LFAYFLEAGIPGPNLHLVQRADVDDEAKTLPLATIDATADAIVAAGIASEDELEAALASLAAFAADLETVIGSPRIFQVWSGGAVTGRMRAAPVDQPADRSWRRIISVRRSRSRLVSSSRSSRVTAS